MALKCLVKVNAVNNLSDARYAAGMGVELLGFDLTPGSDTYVSPGEFAAISGWVSGVKMVGEFGSIPTEPLTRILEQYALDMIELSDPLTVDPEDLSLPLIIKFTNPSADYLQEKLPYYAEMVRYYILEFDQNNPDTSLQQRIRQWARTYPLILSCQLSPELIEDYLDHGITGVAMDGGQEIKPGYKDYDHLAEILDALEIDDI